MIKSSRYPEISVLALGQVVKAIKICKINHEIISHPACSWCSILSNSTHQANLSLCARKGDMMFKTVPGWGIGQRWFSQLGGHNGGVVVSKTGYAFVSANKGVVVFNQIEKASRICRCQISDDARHRDSRRGWD